MGKWILSSIKDKIDPYQFGGLRGISTTHALVDMLHLWHTAIHSSNSIRILFLDFSKAFDLVDHSILIGKFKQLGTPNILLRWLCDFLSDRKQRVKIGNEVSSWLSLTGSMPQGSCLGPLCFVVYISDMSFPSNMWIHKYIDDTTISEQINSDNESQLQQAADAMETWSHENQMKINASKTKEMLISYKKTKPVATRVEIGSKQIDCVSTFKLLGVWLQNDLLWNAHVNYICTRASPRLYYLRQLKRSGMSSGDMITFYKAVVRPVLEYACAVWHPGLTTHQSDTLEMIQKRAMKIIHPDMPYTIALTQISMDTLKDRRHDLCRTFYVNGCKPQPRLNKYLVNRPAPAYKFRNRHQFEIPLPRNERMKKDFITYSLMNFQL